MFWSKKSTNDAAAVLVLVIFLAGCDAPAPPTPPPTTPESDPTPYREAFAKLGRSPRKDATGCVSCHQGMTDLSLITIKRGEEFQFRDPDLQDAAVKAFPDLKVRQRMVHTLMAHPKADIVAGPHSPHASFTCEICHVYEDRKTDLLLTPERKKYWIEHHMQYHPILKDVPMRLTFRLQSMCLKCHMGEEPLPGAELLNRGKLLYQATACNTCHITTGMKTLEADLLPGEKRMRRPGPPLIPIVSKADKKWMYNWVSYPPSFKPTARMPPIFPRGAIVGKLPPQLAPEGIPKEKIAEYEQVLIASAVEYVSSISKPVEQEEIPPGILETEDWKIDDQRLRGQALVQDRGCMGCHRIDENYPPNYKLDAIYLEEEFATNLYGSGNKYDNPRGRRWLYNWLKQPFHYSADTPMPEFGFSEQQRGDIIQFLLSLKIDNEARKARGFKPWEPKEPPLSIEEGETKITPEAQRVLDALLAHQKGPAEAPLKEKILWEGKKVVEAFTCYSCHKLGPEWDAKPVVWGALSHDLLPPRQIMSRMPLFELNASEGNLMVMYLWGAIEGCDPPKDKPAPSARRKALAEGERLLAKYNCQGCHILEQVKLYVRDGDRVINGEANFKSRVERTPALNKPQWAVDWLRRPETLDFGALEKKYPQLVPAYLIERFEPARGGTYALRRLPLITEEEKALALFKMPPSLRTAGRKLNPEWLKEFLRRPNRLRPVDGPLMPRFNFEPGEIEALIEYFRSHDGAAPEDASGRLSEKQLEERYADLLKADQSLQASCVLCHLLDGQGAPYSVDLGQAYRRLQRPWLRAFLGEPGSIYPGTPMPQMPQDIVVDDMTDLLMNYDSMRLAKARRGGPKEIREALRAPSDEVGPLIRVVLTRTASEPALEEVLRPTIALLAQRRLEFPSELERLVANASAGVRAAAIDGLVRTGSTASLDRILERLSDDDGSVRRAALVAVRVFGARQALPRVVALLADPDQPTRLLAVQTLQAMSAVDQAPAVAGRLKDSDAGIRRAALDALADLGARDQLPAIEAALKDDEVNVRVGAVEALGWLDARDRRAALAAALEDPTAAVRCGALLVLARFGEPAPEAAKLLDAGEASVRASAAVCLMRTGDLRGLPAFKQSIQQRPFDALTTRAVEEGFLGLVPAEMRRKEIEPGSRTVEEWLAAIGAVAAVDPDQVEKLKMSFETRARAMAGVMSEISHRTGLVFVSQDGRLTLVSLNRAIERLLE